ncbi:hypothetical protein Nepgr_000288 [Nepenthes gracilis]|uniref:AB hydrolase-1 domain-containing protein n=1 Tax=Nepenthes gracilis TaxID=150966 RepID=A0AAD3P625_NEPGR|nr:hypothetical protein Nepgr_000288 [Nepenthes gracilis]
MRPAARTAINLLKRERAKKHTNPNFPAASIGEGKYLQAKWEREVKENDFPSSNLFEDPRAEKIWVVPEEGFFNKMGNISGHGCSKSIDDPLITSPRIKLSDGRHLAYREAGVPRTEAKYKIIIAHGFGSSKDMSFLAPQALIEELKIYMLLYDRAGYGESDPHTKRSVKSEASDIEELADQLHLGPKFYVIGVSMGSYPIWSCLNYIPHRLQGVALVAGVVNYRWPSLPASLTKDDFRKNLVKLALWLLKRMPGLLYWWMTQKLFPSASVMEKNPVFFNDRDKEVLKRTPGFELLSENKLEHRSVFDNLRRDFMVGFGKWEFDPLKLSNPFPRNKCSVHLWTGFEDRVVPVELQRFVCSKLPWVKYHEVPQGGHLIVYDSDVCASILQDLLLDDVSASTIPSVSTYSGLGKVEKMLRESPYKLDKYREPIGSKKRQRMDLMSNEKSGGSNLVKMGKHVRQNVYEHPTQRIKNKTNCFRFDKHVQSSAAKLKVQSRSGANSRDQIFNKKDGEILQTVGGSLVQPEERFRRLSAVSEGWDKKMKRKRSVGTVIKRAMDNDLKQTDYSKRSSGSKLISCDAHGLRANNKDDVLIGNPSTLIKGKIPEGSRSGYSGVQGSHEASEEQEQSESTDKVIPLGIMRQHDPNSSHSVAQWVGQRMQRISRTRRTDVLSLISNRDDVQNTSPDFTAYDFSAKNSSNRISLTSSNVDNARLECTMELENISRPVLLCDGGKTRGLEHEVKKPLDCGDVAPNTKMKVHDFVFPTKRNRTLAGEHGVEKQGRVGLELPLPGASHMRENSEKVPKATSLDCTRPGSKKNRSKPGRPTSRKLSDRKMCSRAGKILASISAHDADDDHEELLAAAAAARKAIYRACSGRFWKKMEPIFGSISSLDASYLKQQLNIAEKLIESLSHISDPEYGALGVFMHEDLASGEKQGSCSYPLDKDDSLTAGVGVGRKLIKVSSLYQIVLSALIEEDESDHICNGSEGMITSFQFPGDDSHCGSCNYADVETRNGDRLEFEAESKVDVQMQRRCSGDGFSCNMSTASDISRNLSMSDSLYSSGRWQGDDGFSYSDVEFASGICQIEQSGSHPADVNTCRTPLSDCQYQLLCVDDRLALELQSIGLYLDTVPNLAEEDDEVIDQDIMELKEGLYKQIVKKKMNLMKIDEAIEDGKDREKQDMEQIAMNGLVEMAYKGRMVCQRSDGSRVLHKVSKQVAAGFIKRTVARCRKFELTGQSCFREPVLQNAIFSAPEENDEKSAFVRDEGPKHLAKARGSGHKKPGRRPLDSVQTARHASECGFFEELAPLKGWKGKPPRDDGGAASPKGATACQRESCHWRDIRKLNSAATSGQQSAGSFRCDRKTNTKSQMLSSGNTIGGVWPLSTPVMVPAAKERGTEIVLPSPGDGTKQHSSSTEVKEPIGTANPPETENDPMEELNVLDDLGDQEDLSSWFNNDGLQDYDSIGLEIPMDDLSELNMIM